MVVPTNVTLATVSVVGLNVDNPATVVIAPSVPLISVLVVVVATRVTLATASVEASNVLSAETSALEALRDAESVLTSSVTTSNVDKLETSALEAFLLAKFVTTSSPSKVAFKSVPVNCNWSVLVLTLVISAKFAVSDAVSAGTLTSTPTTKISFCQVTSYF